MMQLLSVTVAPEAAEVNSWHTLLALFIAAFVLLSVWAIRTVFFDAETEDEAPLPFNPAPKKPAPAAPSAPAASDDALIAVITAAVAAAMQEESDKGAVPAFRVVSFRKIS